MSDFLVKVVEIEEIQKHPNADSLSITKIYGGYPIVFNDTQHKLQPGMRAVYITVDALLPVERPEFAFLKRKEGQTHHRLKASKIRGIFSMGLLVPCDQSLPAGTDMQEALGVTKYEPPPDMHMGGENEIDPGFLPVYTDLESMRKYPDGIPEGTEVVITEKIHGCLTADSTVRMADGSTKRITKIVVGDMVFGMNSEGIIVPCRVLQTFNNGRAVEPWLRIKTTRRAAGRGPAFASIDCTPEHRFYDPVTHEYRKARELKTGDKVCVLRNDFCPTPLQEQVLLGKLLGDGNLTITENVARITFGHKAQHLGYITYTNQLLGGLAELKDVTTSGHGTLMFRSATIGSYYVKEKFKSFRLNERKTIPAWVAQEMSPISLAFWYMDDGSLSHHNDQEDRANFAVCPFTEAECSVLVEGLGRMGILARYKTYDGYSRICLNAISAERLFLLIAPFVARDMQYKLPLRYRGFDPYLACPSVEFKQALVTQEIVSVERSKKSSLRFDIETETQNYFCPDVLVHNSNARFLYRDGRLWVGSHKNIKRRDEQNMWWQLAIKESLEEKLKPFEYLAVYGEVYGRVQDLKYGVPPGHARLMVFDVLDTRTFRYLDHDETVRVCKEAGLNTAPLLYRGPWSKEYMQLAEGKSTLGDHVREGIVVKSVKEPQTIFGRMILKLVGEGFLMRKGA